MANTDGVPCFDSFDKPPVSFLKLDEMVENEEELIQEQLRMEVIAGEQKVKAIDSFPNLQLTFSSSTSSLEADSEASKEPPEPAARSLGKLLSTTNTVWGSLFGKATAGGAPEVDDAWEKLDGPTATDSGESEVKRHSVVCIGAHTDRSDKKWYLMSNFWKHTPLFLASAHSV